MNWLLLQQIIRENRLLLASTALLLVACVTAWYSVSREEALVANQQQIWNSKRRIVAVHGQTQGLGQYKRDQELIRTLYNTIPYRHEFPKIIGEVLNAIALRASAPGQLHYKHQKTNLPGVLAYSLTCSATGSYPNLKLLIGDLERLSGITTLDGFSLSNADSALNAVTLSLQLTVYLREGTP